MQYFISREQLKGTSVDKLQHILLKTRNQHREGKQPERTVHMEATVTPTHV